MPSATATPIAAFVIVTEMTQNFSCGLRFKTTCWVTIGFSERFV
jgi:H+/Cl- antiporter ClcA